MTPHEMHAAARAYLSRGQSTDEELRALEQAVGQALPADFTAWHRTVGYGEGPIGECYLVVWSAPEIVELNQAYSVWRDGRDDVIVGTDGSGAGVGYDVREAEMALFHQPFVGVEVTEREHLAASWTEFIQRLAAGGGWFNSDA